MTTTRFPPWSDTTAWRHLLSGTVAPEDRAALVRERALAAGAIDTPDAAGGSYLRLPAHVARLDPVAFASLQAQALLANLPLRIV